MRGDLAGWAAGRAAALVARAEAEAVAELKAALIAAATGTVPVPEPPAAPRITPTQPTPRAAPAPLAPARSAPPTAEPPQGVALWAYCVARGEPAAAGPGVDPDGDTRWIHEGELSLLCSSVALADFGEEPLRENLNDMAWLERVARAHEAAIARALEQATIVPLRLCTIFAGEEQARAMLAERCAELTAALDALAGKVEWSVKLLVDR
jgi:Gas vesicle synthesis protein GvpL/GvpF